jgi:hypothetical protein
MELLFSVFLLIGFALLAVRYGYDSRDTIHSKEEELACFGMAWPGGVPMPLVRPVSRRRRVRRKLALALLAFAEWLSPGTPAALARG